jgi:LysR family transcriptional regulator, glycine cleavage system transcriptional activator
MLPSLTGLRTFEAAARHMSFTLAAAELNVTQTAVSHQIRRLEEQLGMPLFIRRNRGLELTSEAQDYLPSIRSAFEDLRRATERLRRSNRDGLLTVSTTASLATKWLVSRVAAFQETHPGIEVRITTSAHLVDFHRDEVDIAVRYGLGSWPGLRADWLMAEQIFPVCSPALLNGRRPLRRPEDLAHHTLLHTMVSREDWQLWLTASGLPLSIATRRGLMFDQGFMAVQAAVEGLGVALGRTHLVEVDIVAGRLLAPFDIVLPQDAGYYVVTPEATADAPKIALFRDWLVQSATPSALATLPQ